MKITIIAGARPNFMKIAPILHEIDKQKSQGENLEYRLVHTGQHYDKKMSGDFFQQLNIPEPNVNLQAGGGSQAEQTANIMVAFEKELIENPADLVLVVGDVTSTMACAITAQKLHTKVAHVEGGIRSGDWTMPEEINRLVTDSISNYFFTTTEGANNNLKASGVSEDSIYFVGNTMIDTLLANKHRFQAPAFYLEKELAPKKYIMMTVHRPANVDDSNQLRRLMEEISVNSEDYKIIFPVHPRTKKIIDEQGLHYPNIIMVDPMGYLEFNFLVSNALAVITDSGGITEETTVLGIPCMTLRDNTERPETCTIGTNEMVGTDPDAIAPALKKLFSGNWKKGGIPELWDGQTAGRIVSHLLKMKN